MSLKEKALEYLSYGLTPVPAEVGTKIPLRKNFSKDRMDELEIEQYPWDAIGIATGSVSQGLEALDFDLKNVEDPKSILEGFKSKVSNTLLKKLVTQSTISGGYHIIYRCEDIEGNRKLAKNADGEVMIETRGEGGFIMAAPSEGYHIVQGSLANIPIISPEERLELMVSCKMLNEQVKKDARKAQGKVSEYHSKFPDYDSDPMIGIKLLTKHGWTLHSEDSTWINMTRPDKDISDGISAGYHKDGMFLYVFTTSTQFETELPYNNHAIFAELECGGRYNVAYAKLFEQGHGVGDSSGLENAEWEEVLERVEFVSTIKEEKDYLEQARKGEIALGKPTGWADVDEYHRIKSNSLNMGIAYDGVGKSLFMNAYAVASNVLHDMSWGMVVPENKTAVTRRRLIELETGRLIQSFKGNPDEYHHYLEKSHKNFHLTTNKKHYSLKEAIEMGIRLYETKGIDAFLIDPYNFFRVDGKNGYSWNNEILSQLRVFADKYCSVYVMAHPSSEAPRKRKDEEGFLLPPSAYDIQGGADFPYRVDDFFVLHRVKNHPDAEVRRTMQFIMHKVKETETGGAEHALGTYSELSYHTQNGFLGYWDSQGNNPMYDALNKDKQFSSMVDAEEDELPF